MQIIKQKRACTIAFQTIQISYGYGSILWQLSIEAAKKLNVNLITMPGRALNPPDKYDRQNNIIYQFVNHYNVDAFIMISPLISGFVDKAKFKHFYSSMKPLPVVNIGEKIDGIQTCALTI